MLNVDIYQNLIKYLDMRTYFNLIRTSHQSYRLFNNFIIKYNENINLYDMVLNGGKDIWMVFIKYLPKKITKDLVQKIMIYGNLDIIKLFHKHGFINKYMLLFDLSCDI